MPILAKLDPRTLFDASPNPYVLLDSALRIVAANGAYLRVTMRESADVLNRVLFDAFPSDPESASGRQLRQSFARVLASGAADHVATIHYPIPRPDGSMEDRYWSATHTPLKDDKGAVEFILQHTEDVTELVQLRSLAALSQGPAQAQSQQPLLVAAAHMGQRAEAVAAANVVLGEERDALRQMFELSPGLMAVTRGPDHVLEIANQAMRRIVGDRPLLGLPVRLALPELAGQGYFDWLDRVYETGEPFIGNGLPAQLQPTPDGPMVSVRVDLVYLALRDAQGQVQGVFVQGQDITGQVVAQSEAMAHAARFQSLAHSLPNQVWTADARGRLDWCNAQTRHYSGLDDSGLLGNAWAGMVHPEDLPLAHATWLSAVASLQPYHVEFRLRRHDGGYRWHIGRALPQLDAEGRLSLWVGTNTDIHDQKTAQALLADLNNELTRRVEQRSAELAQAQESLRQSQKLESIGLLAGGIAHDFNNLLQVVGGNLQLASRALPAQAEAAPLLGRALNGVERGARLAAQLLAFSRRQPLQPRVVNVGRLIHELDELLRRSLGEAIEIRTVIAPGLWNSLVDPSQVESALLNLALNARDAMSGNGRMTIEAANATLDAAYCAAHDEVQPGEYAMVAVTDTGIGMTPEVVRRAFEPFFTTKQTGQSSGLGLSMVYGFVKQSLGHIKVYSEYGVGTTIRLYLPRCAQLEDQPVPDDGELPEHGHETVLVAEDDNGVRDTTVALLKSLGYQVLAAHDAQSALSVIDTGVRIDLLFTDVVMPGPLKGTELARLAQLRRPGLAVLFTSGYTENAIVHGGRVDAGVQLLSKPYSRESLARKLRQTLQQAQRSGPASAAPLHVLVCEDDNLVRDTLAEVLLSLGCTVATAGTIARAQGLMAAQRPDLLITDLGLPDGDGLALAQWTREHAPGTQIAIASGLGRAEAAAGPAGSHSLPKPFDVEQLEQLLERVRRSRAGAA